MLYVAKMALNSWKKKRIGAEGVMVEFYTLHFILKDTCKEKKALNSEPDKIIQIDEK